MNKLMLEFDRKVLHSKSAVEVQSADTSWRASGSASAARSQEALQAAARLKILLGETGRIVAVTGIEASDGATELAAKLALALAAMDESRVLVIDANVREPRLHEIFLVQQQPGFLDLLDNQSNLEDATHSLELSNLLLLPAGHAVTSLAGLLSQPAAGRVFDKIRWAYRYVILDAGIIRNDPDGTLLASLSDGVVAAIAAGARRRHEVLQFRQELKQLNIPLLGVVLTKAE